MTISFQHLGLPERARPIAQLIADYDQYLSLERLPNGHPWLIDNAEKPYAVIHRMPGVPEYVIESYGEGSLDSRIFANIIQGDAAKHGWDLAEFDPINAAAMLLEGRKREDELDEANDRMAFKLRERRTGSGRTHY